MTTAAILVVDDDAPIRRMLERTLAAEGYSVSSSPDGGSAMASVERSAPDLVVLDVAMPGLDGLAVSRLLRRKGLAVPILMLTARDGVPDRVAGLDAGADDYLVKPFKFKELLARIRAVLRRHHLSLTRRLSLGDLALDRETREVWRAEQPIDLTPREFDLLELLIAHPRQVFSRETLLNRIWGYDHVADPNVVEVYISSLRDKIGDKDRQLIRTVRGVGYTLHG